MLKLFKPKYHSMLGIDISSTSVKIIEISGKDDNRCVEGYGKELIPPGVIESNAIKDIDAIASCIKKVLSDAHLTAKSASIAVPDSAVISKTIQINDGLNDDEIEELVIMEADKYIPYPIDEINIDFQILGPSAKNASMQDILIVASRSENVSNKVEAITKAGLEVKIVDVESYAVERAIQHLAHELPAYGQDKVIAVIDIGAHYAHLFVFHGMKLIFTREEEFGGKQLVDATALHYGISYQEALQRQEQGNMPDDYEQVLLTPFMDNILVQIKRTLQFFFSTSHHGFVDHILLAGGVAKLPDLVQLVHEKTSIPTSVANPFKHIPLSKKINSARVLNDAPSLLIACGLALRNLR
ncbi:type IV pilus assembly protein PilM [Legionella dresdenensis]|uniref:Type IV pilus assembly protein PilM n=1 Tax=Legionella dresdenensis TaxID=450200 RepID=A0ABV8CE82_9GAMM